MKNPVKGYKQSLFPAGDVTQWFAENPALYAFMDMKGHNGVDIVRPHGSDMFAVEDGTVIEVNDNPQGYGRHVRFISNEPGKDGYYHEWTYGHCNTIFVNIGDEVYAGQKIATMGNTGFVVSGKTPFWKSNPYAGTHLHLGLRLMKRPRRGGWSYAGSNIKVDVIGYSNGFKGAIDPAPYLVGAEDNVATPTMRQLQLTVLSLAKTVVGLLTKK
jgi:murein DD-endopeptidase MepM/ murein hydrolase activator NlpD